MNRRPAYVLAAIALCCLALSACGNKGPLVLPDKPADGTPAEDTPAQPAPAADDAKTPHR
jgi:predicted small lipoprotein YifL